MKITRETAMTYRWEDIVRMMREDAAERALAAGLPAPDLANIEVKIVTPNYAPEIRVTLPEHVSEPA